MFVVDSSVLIELTEQRPRTPHILALLQATALTTTSICVHELLTGAASVRQKVICEQLLSQIHIFEHTLEAARIGAQIEQNLDRKGLKLHSVDVMIAAICIVNDTELVTLDQGFKRIEGLKVHVIR